MVTTHVSDNLALIDFHGGRSSSPNLGYRADSDGTR